MIKKYMNQLYNEIEQIRRRLISGKMRYFGDRDFGNASKYTVYLKDGSFFVINIGAYNIPKLRKKDIAFINKLINYDSNDTNWKYNCRDCVNSDVGFIRYDDNAPINNCRYEVEKAEKYKIDFDKEIDVGSWD